MLCRLCGHDRHDHGRDHGLNVRHGSDLTSFLMSDYLERYVYDVLCWKSRSRWELAKPELWWGKRGANSVEDQFGNLTCIH